MNKHFESLQTCAFWIVLSMLSGLPLFTLSGQQRDITPTQTHRHASLSGWFDSKRLFILNQSENYGGPYYPRDLFRENIAAITPEHEIDLITYGFTPFEEYRWNQTSNGLRGNIGSLNATIFSLRANMKNSVTFNERHHLFLNATQYETVRAERTVFLVRYLYELTSSHYMGFEMYADDNKSDIDATFIYSYLPSEKISLTGQVTWLDFMHNLTQKLAKESSSEYNTSYPVVSQYAKSPLLFELKSDIALTSFLRTELFASYMTPSEEELEGILINDQFLDKEQVHLLGTLLEFHQSLYTVGVSFQRQFSKLRRIPFGNSESQNDYTTTQWTNTLGVYGATEFFGFHWDQFVWYEFNVDKLYGDQVPENLPAANHVTNPQGFNFREQRWKMKSDLSYPFDIWYGHRLEPRISLHIDNRHLLMDKASNGVVGLEFRQVYPIVRDRSERFNLSFTYHFNDYNAITLGGSYDLDGDLQSGYGAPKAIPSKTHFDGAFGKMTLKW